MRADLRVVSDVPGVENPITVLGEDDVGRIMPVELRVGRKAPITVVHFMIPISSEGTA